MRVRRLCTSERSGQVANPHVPASSLLRNTQLLQATRWKASSRVGTTVFCAYVARPLPQVSSHPILSCGVYDDVNGNVNQHAARLARVWSAQANLSQNIRNPNRGG